MDIYRRQLSRPSTMQDSWSSPTLLTRHCKATSLKDSQNKSGRPHTTGGDSRRIPRNSELSMEGMTPLRTKSVQQPYTFQDNWASSKVATHQTPNVDGRTLSITQRPHTSNNSIRVESNAHLLSKTSRPQTATSALYTSTKKTPPFSLSNEPNPIKKLQSVKSYSSPRFSFKGFSPPDSPKQSIFDAQSLKHPKDLKEPPKVGRPSSPLKAKPMHYLLDPSLNLRSPSISNDFKVKSDDPMESLVTQMPLPPPTPTHSSTQSISPSLASKMLRKKIEADLRMYPRNTWGPVTKWGYQEELAPGWQHQKEHFIKNNDKLEKQRLASRNFGHKRHWVKFKNLTNLWEQQESQQSVAYVDEKERLLTNSEKMLHSENDKRIAKAKGIDKARREKNRWNDFKRLEKREGEYIDKMEIEQRLREDGRTKSNDSGVVYNIVTLEYPNNYAGDLLRFEDAQIRWRQCMRALRIQSKQSGARMYNVLSWKPHKPCCVPSPKPNAPIAPDINLAPSPRKPKLPLPRNMLHLKDSCDDVPVGCTNDMLTNW